MPIYVLRCGGGHTFEVIQSFAAPLPPCPDCGSATRKIPAPFAIGGRAARSLPPPPEAMPQTWRGTYNGNREYVTELRRIAERRRDIEDRHPELAGDRRPILAHEGRFAAAPLRAGDQPGPTPHGAHSAHGSEGSHGPSEVLLPSGTVLRAISSVVSVGTPAAHAPSGRRPARVGFHQMARLEGIGPPPPECL